MSLFTGLDSLFPVDAQRLITAEGFTIKQTRKCVKSFGPNVMVYGFICCTRLPTPNPVKALFQGVMFGQLNCDIVLKKFPRPLLMQPLCGSFEAEVEQFIVAYYTNFVYSQQKINTFYDKESSTIWRQSLNSRAAASFWENRHLVVPEIREGSKVTVVDYNFSVGAEQITVVVYGKIEFEDQSEPFVQCFGLAHKSDRIFIISDSLRLGVGAVQPPEDVVLVPAPKNAKRNEGHGARRKAEKDNRYSWTAPGSD